MRIHSLQHIWFEDLANIELWLRMNGHSVTKTHLWNHERLPSLGEFDWLIVMGGPMNIYEENKYRWLIREKELISRAVAHGKLVLGICLGAQLIADVLGERVYKNECREIGWHPVRLTEGAKGSPVFNVLPREFIAFHWHGDTFYLPPGCKQTAESDGCLNQAFEYDNGRVIGLQFHLESSLWSVRCLIQNCGEELTEGKYVQTADEILSHQEDLQTIEKTMGDFLKQMQRTLVNHRVAT